MDAPPRIGRPGAEILGEGDPFAAFQTAVEARDAASAAALFSPDARFLSPVVNRPYVGPEAIELIMDAVSRVFEDFRYTSSYSGVDAHVLEFSARIGELEVQGVDMLRRSAAHLTELCVMVRPYTAATALRERMTALLG